MADRHVLYKHGVKRLPTGRASVTFAARHGAASATYSSLIRRPATPRGKGSADTPLFQHGSPGKWPWRGAALLSPTVTPTSATRPASRPTIAHWDNRTAARLSGEGRLS